MPTVEAAPPLRSDAHPLVELVAVGRELLTGRTVDTNSAWLAGRLTAAGARVGRVTTVDDDPEAIAAAVRDAEARGAALVVTTGGLGPTFDDLTLAGIAAALGRCLVEQADALAFVTRRYAELAAAGAVADAALTPPRRKMAALPEDGRPIDNAVGTAPGVLVGKDAFAVLSLPGVPAEMRAVFEEALPLVADRVRGSAVCERELASGSGDESVIAVAVERVMAEVPGVHVKSLATAFSPDCDLRIRITARGRDAAEAEARAAAAAARLSEELAHVRRR
jgi:molybdenum cofactor synthesis domain-containing protein